MTKLLVTPIRRHSGWKSIAGTSSCKFIGSNKYFARLLAQYQSGPLSLPLKCVPSLCSLCYALMQILFDFKGTNSQQFYHFSSTPEASPTTSELLTNDAV
jgi:hypothetical protein